MDINSFEGTFLHVGCGNSTKERTPFANYNWKEIRFDINPNANPDIIGTITDMKGVNASGYFRFPFNFKTKKCYCSFISHLLNPI